MGDDLLVTEVAQLYADELAALEVTPSPQKQPPSDAIEACPPPALPLLLSYRDASAHSSQSPILGQRRQHTCPQACLKQPQFVPNGFPWSRHHHELPPSLCR